MPLAAESADALVAPRGESSRCGEGVTPVDGFKAAPFRDACGFNGAVSGGFLIFPAHEELYMLTGAQVFEAAQRGANAGQLPGGAGTR